MAETDTVKRKYTAYDVAEVILNGDSISEQKYVATHFPFMTIMISKAGADCLPILKALPDNVTARKFESGLVRKLEAEAGEEAEPPANEKPAKPRPKRKREPEPEEDEEVEVEVEVEEPDDDDSEDEGLDYSKMSAMELYKLCVERGIDVKKRQKANVYAELLEKWDADNAEADSEADADDDDEDDDDDWDI